MQFIDHRLLPAVTGSRVRLKIEVVPFRHHRFEAGVGVRPWTGGQIALVDVPAGDGAGSGIKQHLGWLKAMAPGGQRSEDPVAVATPLSQAFHLHMPVITGAVAEAIEFDHPPWRRGGAVREQQQLNPVRSGGRHREIHPAGGATAAQGPGAAGMNAAQGRWASDLQTRGFVAF